MRKNIYAIKDQTKRKAAKLVTSDALINRCLSPFSKIPAARARGRRLRPLGLVVPSERPWATLRPHPGGIQASWTVERRACRSSAPAGSCNCAMGGAAAPSACAAWAARARPWRRAPTTRDGPAQPPGTTPHRSADTLRSVPGAGGAIELALLCAAA